MSKGCKDASIIVVEQWMLIDLLVLEINEFDVILGIDWLSKYHCIIDHITNVLYISTLREELFEYNIEL